MCDMERLQQKVTTLKEAQPLIDMKNKIALVHNGNIPNIKTHDSRYLLELIIHNLEVNEGDINISLVDLISIIPAAYSLLIMYENKIYVLRDRFGIRPLYYCVTNECCFGVF